MKKFLNVGSLVAILVTIFIIIYLALPPKPAESAGLNGAFKDFPVGQTRIINLRSGRATLENLTPRQQLDQTRDWLLFTAVASSGMSAAEINEALFDLPPVRRGYVQPVANFEYGDTRSCLLSNGQVLALIPADHSDERSERLARVADEHRKNLGTMPEKLVVFEYELNGDTDPARQTAMLRRVDSVKVKDLYTPAAGYYEVKINTLDDLKRFMGQIDDLTYASLKDGLTVGGRKIKGHSYRGIRVEEIATLYQSEAKIRESTNIVGHKIKEFDDRWKSRTYSTPAERQGLEQEYAKEERALRDDLRRIRDEGQLVRSSGFSLDPTIDFPSLVQKFDAIIVSAVREIMSDQLMGGSLIDNPVLEITPGVYLFFPTERSLDQRITQAREGLAHKDADPLFELLGKILVKDEHDRDLAKTIKKAIDSCYPFQAARYDGELKGTETGMVLFYTDLLAKLWALNYQNSAPTGTIHDFRALTVLPVSSVYQQEFEELSNTRLWFGRQDRGFQIADGGQNLLFGRNATRVFAASSSSLNPGKESQPNAQSSAFLGWWNDHYEEIARFEPEYERLDEIMKWSLVITWLNQQQKTAKLGFLQGEKVVRDNWFPDWVKNHPELRYQKWDSIRFSGRGANQTSPETLAQLTSGSYSQFGQEWTISGGVSLASEEVFVARTAVSAETKIARTAIRSDQILSESTPTILKNFDNLTVSLRNVSPEIASTTATTRSGLKMRGAFGEVANAPVGRVIERNASGLKIDARIGDGPIGELTIGNAENGFRVGWASRDLDKSMSLGRQLSTSKDPGKLLELAPGVETALALPGDGRYLVKFEGSERWVSMSREGSATPRGPPSVSLESDYFARVGDFSSVAKNYNLRWVKPDELPALLAKGTPLGTRGQRVAAGLERGGVVEQLRSGDYAAAASDLIKDPAGFKAKTEAYFETGVSEVSGLLRDGQFEGAGLRTDQLIDIYGPREELAFYKTLTQLDLPASDLQDLARITPTPGSPSFLDEVSARINQRFPQSNGESVRLVHESADLGIECNISGVDREVPLTRADLDKSKLRVYVQDGSGLNNLDSPVALRGALDGAISGKSPGRAFKLSRESVAKFNPSRIRDQADGTIYRAASTQGIGSGFVRPRLYVTDTAGSSSGRFVPRYYWPYILPCPDRDKDRRRDSDCEDSDRPTIVVVIRK